MRDVDKVRVGVDCWKTVSLGLTEQERFLYAHTFLSQVVHEAAHLAELQRSFSNARNELERDRDTQIRILEDSQSLELARVAATNDVPSDSLMESHQLQSQILRNKFARALDELERSQRAEYQQFVIQFASIELQSEHSKRMESAEKKLVPVVAPPVIEPAAAASVTSVLARQKSRGMALLSGAMSSATAPSKSASKPSALPIVEAPSPLSPSAQRKVAPSDAAASPSNWVESECLKTSLITLLDEGDPTFSTLTCSPSSLVRLSLVELLQSSDVVQKQLDLPCGLLRASLVCNRVKLASTPELHFDPTPLTDPIVGNLQYSRHSNLPSCDILFSLGRLSSGDGTSLSQRRLQSRELIEGLRRVFALCLSAGVATVNIPLFLYSSEDVAKLLEEDAAWEEHARAVVQCTKEALLWPLRTDESLRHIRFYIAGVTCPRNMMLQLISIVRTPFIKGSGSMHVITPPAAEPLEEFQVPRDNDNHDNDVDHDDDDGKKKEEEEGKGEGANDDMEGEQSKERPLDSEEKQPL